MRGRLGDDFRLGDRRRHSRAGDCDLRLGALRQPLSPTGGTRPPGAASTRARAVTRIPRPDDRLRRTATGSTSPAGALRSRLQPTSSTCAQPAQCRRGDRGDAGVAVHSVAGSEPQSEQAWRDSVKSVDARDRGVSALDTRPVHRPAGTSGFGRAPSAIPPTRSTRHSSPERQSGGRCRSICSTPTRSADNGRSAGSASARGRRVARRRRAALVPGRPRPPLSDPHGIASAPWPAAKHTCCFPRFSRRARFL